jgi:hypothetical protein
MLTPYSSRPKREWPVLLYASVPLVLTTFLWVTSSYELSVPRAVAAFVLCWIPWASYKRWSKGGRQNLPLFALIAAMYWLTYAVPVFWGSRRMSLVGGFVILPEQALTKSLYLAVIGVVSLWAGMNVVGGWDWSPSFRVDVPRDPWRWSYLRLVLALSVHHSLGR